MFQVPLSFLFSSFVIEELTPQNVGSTVKGVAFHPTENILASCSADGSVKLWNTDTGWELSTLRGHRDAVSSLAFKPDDPNILVTGSRDKTIKLWDLSTSTCLSTIKGHTRDNEACKCHPREWSDPFPVSECPVKGHFDAVVSVSWNNDGTRLASGGLDKSVRIWDTARGEQLNEVWARGDVARVSYSPDGSKLAAAAGMSAAIFDPETNAVLCTVEGHAKDNEECTCRHDAGILKNCYVANPNCPVRGHARAVASVSWSPDGTRFITASADGAVRIWDLSAGRER